MPRDPRRESLYLADIVEAARTVARWLIDHGDHWESDDILRNAVLRQLLIIGEASNSLSQEVRDTLPEIPWHEIRGFRNHAVHAYFALDWAIVWEIADVNLPGLEEHIMMLLKAEFPDIAATLDAHFKDGPGSDSDTSAAGKT